MNSIELIHPLAELYAQNITANEDLLLQKITESTLASHTQAHMLSGKIQGQFLKFLSTLIQPKYVLEIGTFTGYSALCLADGLTEDGCLHTIELREADALIAQQYFNESKHKNQIQLHIGNAQTIIPTLEYKWDIVFIDADKTGYLNYYELVLPQVKTNGLIIVDNVLFHGQVLQEPLKGKNAKAIDQFNNYVANDQRVEQVLLTVRDGLLLIKKRMNEKNI